MAYLSNRSVNLLNAHVWIQSLAINGAGVFSLVYLLKSGVSLTLALLAVAGMLAMRFIFRPMVVLVAVRRGLRFTVAASAAFTALRYAALPLVHGAGAALAIYSIVASLADTFYWTSYHAYFASLGDTEHRGKQIAVREAMSAVCAIIGPAAGGWVIAGFGPYAAFGIATVLQLLSALPLLGVPEVAVVKVPPPGSWRKTLPGILLFAADGWIQSAFAILWPMILFLALGQSYVAYGGALALAGLAGALGALVLGKLIDDGHGNRVVLLALGSLAALTLLRAVLIGSPAGAVLATAAGALVGCLYTPTLMTAIYNLAKKAPCTLRFHVACEGGWDIGGSFGCLLAAGASTLGLSLSWPIAVSVGGILLMGVLLTRHYLEGVAGLATLEAGD